MAQLSYATVLTVAISLAAACSACRAQQKPPTNPNDVKPAVAPDTTDPTPDPTPTEPQAQGVPEHLP